jgi:hypothetical protein
MLKIFSLKNFFKKKKQTKPVAFEIFYLFYLIMFFEHLFKNKCYLKFLPFRRSCKKIAPFLLWLDKKVPFKLKRFSHVFFYKEFLNVLVATLFYKDISLFSSWFTRFFEKLSARRHRYFLSSLKYFLMYSYVKLFKYFNCLGLKISVRGKISVKGNSKKKRFRLGLGVNSISKKNLKINYSDGIVRTKTGVLGLNFTLFY